MVSHAIYFSLRNSLHCFSLSTVIALFYFNLSI